MALFDPLDRALRWLREERRLRQYEIAEAAGITKAMLSAYETGKQKPSLDSLDKLLTALDCDLADLQHALDIFHHHSSRSRLGEEIPPLLAQPLPSRSADDLSEVLESLHRLLLYLHQTASVRTTRRSEDGGEGSAEG